MGLKACSQFTFNMADDCDDACFEGYLGEAFSSLNENGGNIVLKEEQKKAIKHLFERKDLLAVLPTGFGKSLIFQRLVLMTRTARSGNFTGLLVITPLVSIIRDQIMEIQSLNLSGCNLSEKLDCLEDIEGGQFNIVYASAESAIDTRFLQMLKKDSVFTRGLVACVVDESHTIETWTGSRKYKGKKSGVLQKNTMAFRGAYGELSILRSFVKKGTPFAALTGTADKETCSVIISKLSLKDPLIIQISPNRVNLRFSVREKKKTAMFEELDWLIDHVKSKGDSGDKTIIFCNTMNDIACVVNYLMMKLGRNAYSPNDSYEQSDCLLGIYHSSCWQHSKDRVVESFKGQGKVRVVVASTALSMGVNFSDIRYIVNWGPARNLLDQHQEAGRAGRDGLASHILIIYHGNQLKDCEDDVKEFVKTKGCLRVAAYKSLDDSIKPQEPPHSCCSHCASKCNCDDECASSAPLFETFSPSNQGATSQFSLSRPACNQDKIDLRDSLNEVRDSLVKRRSVFDNISSHGFSDQLIHDVVSNCHRIFTVNDLLELCPVFSISHALKVLEIIQELFLDIPNFDEFMDVIRLEVSPRCQNLQILLRDVTLDDSVESEDEEEFMEVLTV